MWPLLRQWAREALRLLLALGWEQLESLRHDWRQALARERQRAFELLALLCLGLLCCSLAAAGMLLLVWWALPEHWRLPVMALLLAALGVVGLGVLAAARRRALAP